MSQAMQYSFRLFGPRKGQTVTINGHPFVNGIYNAVVSAEAASTLMSVLSFYGAYAHGTPKYYESLVAEEAAAEEAAADAASAAAAQEAAVAAIGAASAASAAAAEATNGTNDVSTSDGGRPAEPLSGGVRPDGAGPSASAAVASNGHVESEDGSAGTDSVGDGHGHSGVPKFEEAASRPEPVEPASIGDESLNTAVKKLDPEIDEHWVMTGAHKGMPKLAAVEDAYGRAGVTRQDVEAAIPGWNRDRAVEAALEG